MIWSVLGRIRRPMLVPSVGGSTLWMYNVAPTPKPFSGTSAWRISTVAVISKSPCTPNWVPTPTGPPRRSLGNLIRNPRGSGSAYRSASAPTSVNSVGISLPENRNRIPGILLLLTLRLRASRPPDQCRRAGKRKRESKPTNRQHEHILPDGSLSTVHALTASASSSTRLPRSRTLSAAGRFVSSFRIDRQLLGQRPRVGRLDNAAIGNGVDVRKADLDERGTTPSCFAHQFDGRLKVGIAGRDKRDEGLLAFGLQAGEKLIDGIHVASRMPSLLIDLWTPPIGRTKVRGQSGPRPIGQGDDSLCGNPIGLTLPSAKHGSGAA